MVTLTHHKKSVRALAIHPTEYSFASGSAGGNNIKKWKCPEGTFVFNFSGHNAIINTMSVNAEGVFFSGGLFLFIHFTRSEMLTNCLGDNGSLTFWDYNSGTPFQTLDDIPQPGSLEAEAGLFCSTFDVTGTRLITGGADKTIKVCPRGFQLLLALTTMLRYMPKNQSSYDTASLQNTCLLYVPMRCCLQCEVMGTILKVYTRPGTNIENSRTRQERRDHKTTDAADNTKGKRSKRKEKKKTDKRMFEEPQKKVCFNSTNLGYFDRAVD